MSSLRNNNVDSITTDKSNMQHSLRIYIAKGPYKHFKGITDENIQQLSYSSSYTTQKVLSSMVHKLVMFLVIYELNFESIFIKGINLKLQRIIRIFQATKIK